MHAELRIMLRSIIFNYIHTYIHIWILEKTKFPGSLMKGGIPRNSCLAQWSKIRKRRLLYPHSKFSLHR